MSMNVLHQLLTVIPMLCVPILKAVLHVLVTPASKEMELPVQVKKLLARFSYIIFPSSHSIIILIYVSPFQMLMNVPLELIIATQMQCVLTHMVALLVLVIQGSAVTD